MKIIIKHNMTEKEKMLAGEKYLASDPELKTARTKNRLLIQKI